MKRKLFAAGVFATAVIAAVGLGSGAVTNASGGVATPRTVTDLGNGAEGVNNGSYQQNLVNLEGKIQLVATGTSSKTLILGGNGCGNAWMAWDDSPSGAAYKVTRRSSWNAPGTCGGEVLNAPQLEMMTPSGDYSSHGTLSDGETVFNEIDDIGSLTTKFEWGNVDADWASVNVWYCAYLIPGGGGTWENGGCIDH